MLLRYEDILPIVLALVRWYHKAPLRRLNDGSECRSERRLRMQVKIVAFSMIWVCRVDAVEPHRKKKVKAFANLSALNMVRRD